MGIFLHVSKLHYEIVRRIRLMGILTNLGCVCLFDGRLFDGFLVLSDCHLFCSCYCGEGDFDGRGGQANDMTMKCTHIEMCSYLVITMMLNWITCRYKHWNRLMFVYLTSKLPPAVHIASLNQNIALIGAIIWISASMNRYLS